MASSAASGEWPEKQSLYSFDTSSNLRASSASIEADVIPAVYREEYPRDVLQPIGCALLSSRAKLAVKTKAGLQSKRAQLSFSSSGKRGSCRSLQGNSTFEGSDSLGSHFFDSPIEDSGSDTCESLSGISSAMLDKEHEGTCSGWKADGFFMEEPCGKSLKERFASFNGSTSGANRGRAAPPVPDGSRAASEAHNGRRDTVESAESGSHCARLEVKGGKPSCVDHVEGAEDGRYWLDRLDKLRTSTSKEEYKKERSRVVDALIRRAASYPKVSGIYFDKHQLRWSVGWAHHGKRAAKYFPVKVFGMREGYGMAVRFKSTKSVNSSSTICTGSETSRGATEHLESCGKTLTRNLSLTAEHKGSTGFAGVLDADTEKKALHCTFEGCSRSSIYSNESDMRATSQSLQNSWGEHGSAGAVNCNSSPAQTMRSSSRYHTADGGDPLDMSEPPPPFWRRFISLSAGSKALTFKFRSEYPPQSQSSTNNSQDDSAVQASYYCTADGLRIECAPSCENSKSGLLRTHGWPTALSSLSRWRSSHVDTKKNVSLLGAKTPEAPLMPFYIESADKVPVAESSSPSLLYTLLSCRDWEGSWEQQALAQPSNPAVSHGQLLHTQSQPLTLGYQHPTNTQSSDCSIDAATNQIVWAAHQAGAAITGTRPGYQDRMPPNLVETAADPTLSKTAAEIHGWMRSVVLAQDTTAFQCITRIGTTGKNGGREFSSAACPNLVKQRESIAAVCARRHKQSKFSGTTQASQVHPTTGIHFDKHSLRWKATWYNNMGQRKAKYFPIGRTKRHSHLIQGRYGFDCARMLAIQTRLSYHVPRSSRCIEPADSQELSVATLGHSPPLVPAVLRKLEDRTRKAESRQKEIERAITWGACTVKPTGTATLAIDGYSTKSSQWVKPGALPHDGYDEDKDRHLSKAPSRVLIRHASRLSRVPGIWFDKKQLRWACTFTDTQSGKRRAEYFPIRQFGFLGARRLAMTARKRLAQFQIQTCTSVQQKYQSGSEFADEASALLPSEHTSSTPTFFEWGQPKNSDVHDLWNKYLLETMQRHGTPTPTLTHGGASEVGQDASVFFVGACERNNQGSSLLEDDQKSENETISLDSGNVLADSGKLLSLEKEAVQFLLLDLKTRCLRGLSRVLPPGDSVRHMSILQRHSVCVDYAEQCQSLEQYLLVFAECIKHMKLPSHLCQAEQRRLLHNIAALSIPPLAGR